MKKAKLLIFCILLSLSSCIEITEKVKVNADGSGSFNLIVDMGMLAGAMNSENTSFDVSILDKIRKTVNEAPSLLDSVKGISNVVSLSDAKTGYYEVSFDFQKSKHLNIALYTLVGQKKKAFFPSLYKIKKHRFCRKDLSPLIRKAMSGKGSGSYNQMLYSYINFISLFSFPSDIKKNRNIRAEMSDSRTITSTFTLDELMKGDYFTGHDVRF